jgi:hypothetical protein
VRFQLLIVVLLCEWTSGRILELLMGGLLMRMTVYTFLFSFVLLLHGHLALLGMYSAFCWYIHYVTRQRTFM